MQKNYRLIKKNEREKEQENEEDDNLIVKNELEMNKVINEVKFEEGGPEKKKRNK